MFRKILIANRGEIACRVARTARSLGIASVAVYSDADKDAPHVKACNEAVPIGPSAPAESYLVIEKILEAARRTGAEAVHPGYGFLSENAAFADALEQAGIVFIGPTAKTIRAMGSKSAAKDLMEAAGVPTTPGYQGDDQSPDVFLREAKRIGYPVLLKATAGGGGKGMRMVAREEELVDALRAAQREAKSAFGDDRFLIEKYVARARHLEVQIFGDGKGEVVHLFERDCSVQRRHQKVIEEAPAPNLPAAVRAKLLQAGVDAGKAVDYRGAGTVEFLYDSASAEGGVYFMEMNTRLQVEHPVTEAITGVDLVEWQLRVAAGENLPRAQDAIGERGHAFEARLYAEDPDRNFAPSIGRLTMLRLPHETARIDSGVEEGGDVTPHYDPMIAKIITHGATRQEALGRLRTALGETRVAGLETNARFLHALAGDADFAAGDVSTRYIEEHPGLMTRAPAGERAFAALLADRLLSPAKSGDPWEALAGFRLNKPSKAVSWLEIDGAAALARAQWETPGAIAVELEPNASAASRREGVEPGETIRFSFTGERDGPDLALTLGGARFRASLADHHGAARVFIDAEHWDLPRPDPLSGDFGAHHSAEGSLTAPMPGVVTAIAAKAGEAVSAGATLLLMEAMKMEHAIKAPVDGVIKAFRFKPGDQVKDGDLLVEFEEEA